MNLQTKLETCGFRFNCGKKIPAILYSDKSPRVQHILTCCRKATPNSPHLIGEDEWDKHYYVLTLNLHRITVHILFRDFIDNSFLIYLLENKYLKPIHITYIVLQGKVHHWPQPRFFWLLNEIEQKHHLGLAALLSVPPE